MESVIPGHGGCLSKVSGNEEVLLTSTSVLAQEDTLAGQNGPEAKEDRRRLLWGQVDLASQENFHLSCTVVKHTNGGTKRTLWASISLFARILVL